MRSFLICVVGVAGCGFTDVSGDMKLLADASGTAISDVRAVVRNDAPEIRQARIRESARREEAWAISGACDSHLPLDGATAADCRLDRGPGFAALQPSDAVIRKLNVLEAYVAALDSLTEATSETALFAAQAAALESFGELGSEIESKAVAKTVAELAALQPKSDAILGFAFERQRARMLRDVVLSKQQDVQRLCNEIVLTLGGSSAEGAQLLDTWLTFVDAKGAADTAFAIAEGTPTSENTARYAASLSALDKAHADFVKAGEASVFQKVAAVGAAHSALAERLRNPNSRAEIKAFIKRLTELRKAIETEAG